MKNDLRFFQSNSCVEGLSIEYIPPAKKDINAEGEFWFSYWEQTKPCPINPWKFGLLHRLKYAWYILRKGIPWTDMLVFNRDTAKTIAYHILYRLDQTENKEKPVDLDKLFD